MLYLCGVIVSLSNRVFYFVLSHVLNHLRSDCEGGFFLCLKKNTTFCKIICILFCNIKNLLYLCIIKVKQ